MWPGSVIVDPSGAPFFFEPAPGWRQLRVKAMPTGVASPRREIVMRRPVLLMLSAFVLSIAAFVALVEFAPRDALQGDESAVATVTLRNL